MPDKTRGDEELMLAVAKGDFDAFNEIMRRHQGTAWRVAYRFLVDPVEAEDIAQEAFLKILSAAPRYKPTATFSTYLYRVVTRLCIDRASKKRPVYTDDLSGIAGRSSNPGTTLLFKERETQVRNAINALPPRQRMSVILKYYEGLGYADIARSMGVTVKSVERLLSRARKTLQSHLSHINEI